MNTTAVTIYRQALCQWNAHQARFSTPGRAERLLDPCGQPPKKLAAILRDLPSSERRPVAFGLYLAAAAGWSPAFRSVFMGEFIPNPAPVEREVLDAAAAGSIGKDGGLPVTLEEFPSRLWQRALARNSPGALVKAGRLAVIAMWRLLYNHEPLPAPRQPFPSSLKPGESIEVHVPSGDIPDIVDLIALPPARTDDLKRRVSVWIDDQIMKRRLVLGAGAGAAVLGWARGGDAEAAVIAETRNMLENHKLAISLRTSHHLIRLGRLMFRLGQRRLGNACATELGIRSSGMGWHLQAIRGGAHARHRAVALRLADDPDLWLKDPALACCSMSIPLWLHDGVARVSEIAALLDKAAGCPWVFPRLGRIFQWHLALADDWAALQRIEMLDPLGPLGLSSAAPALVADFSRNSSNPDTSTP